MVVMAFDERGQADTFERKTEVCARAYRLLTDAGIAPSDIIFDPNILAVATGIEHHARYGLDFIRAARWIRQNLPGAGVSGGLSNLSFSFRGNNFVREAIHAIFLANAAGSSGMNMAIVNPSTLIDTATIPEPLAEAITDTLLCRRADADERLIAVAAFTDAPGRKARRRHSPKLPTQFRHHAAGWPMQWSRDAPTRCPRFFRKRRPRPDRHSRSSKGRSCRAWTASDTCSAKDACSCRR